MATAAARRYAKAVFELAQQEGKVDEWARRLARVRELFSDPQVAAVLTNPTIATEQREGLVAAAPHVLDEEGTNLARHRVLKAVDLGDAISDRDDAADIGRDESRVEVFETFLDDFRDLFGDRVEKELSARLGKDVQLTLVVDPRILGGLKLQYGDRVVDASVATRLQQLRRRLAAT